MVIKVKKRNFLKKKKIKEIKAELGEYEGLLQGNQPIPDRKQEAILQKGTLLHQNNTQILSSDNTDRQIQRKGA